MNMDNLTDDEWFRQMDDEQRAFLHPDEWGLDLRPVFDKVLSPPPSPDGLSDREVTGYLRCMVDLLARHHLCLVATNHLSERELYRYIVGEVLPHPVGVGPDPVGALVYHEVCSCESDEWLSFYASEEDRREWQEVFGGPLPERRPLVSDRDTWIELLAEACRDQPLPAFEDDPPNGVH